MHSGDLNAGHYYAFLRPEKNGEFYKFDDDRVTRATKREALDENFGGEYNFGHNDVTRLQQNRLPIKRSMNAYMLVYLRKNKIDEILVPVATEDVPEHLRMYHSFQSSLPPNTHIRTTKLNFLCQPNDSRKNEHCGNKRSETARNSIFIST